MRQVIPLDSSPNQTMEVSVNIDNETKRFSLSFKYNEDASYWVMRISNPSTNVIILDSIPLLRGGSEAANILDQYKYLKIGSCYLVKNGGNLDYPDDISLGSDFSLLWGDTPSD